MSKGGIPPGASGDAFESGFGNSQKERYELIIAQAQTNREEAENLLLYAAAFAREWQETDACAQALNQLAVLHLEKFKYKEGLVVLEEVSRLQSASIKQQNHPDLINTYKRMGLCYAKLRQPERAIQVLRDAVVRCQSSEHDVLDELVDSLCLLSGVYRQIDKADRAKTCIRQAYAVVADEDSRPDLQIQVLEELAALTYLQHRPRAAALAFIRVLQLKQETLGAWHPGCADTFVALGMCYVDLRNCKDAESCFIQAMEIMRRAPGVDRTVIASTLSKLGGVYHSMGNFVEANIIEQGASEVIGRATEMRLGFFKQFDAGLAAQRRGHFDVAQACYRKALMDLEMIFDKQAVIRVPILCRLYEMASARKLKVQAKTLMVEIDEGLRLICAHENGVDLCGRMLRLARLFRLLGFNEFSDTCYRFAEKLARDKQNPELISILNEHGLLIDRMDQSDEVKRAQKYVRRVRRIFGISSAIPKHSTIELGITNEDLSKISFIGDILDASTD